MARADVLAAITAADAALARCETIRRLLIDSWPRIEGNQPDGK